MKIGVRSQPLKRLLGQGEANTYKPGFDGIRFRFLRADQTRRRLEARSTDALLCADRPTMAECTPSLLEPTQ